MIELPQNNEELTFEDFRNDNGISFWWASDLMKMLNYSDMKSFSKVLDKATKTFVSLNIAHYENIIAQKRNINNLEIQDFKLTRFACYISVMNADPKKIEVAKAQLYFAEQTRKYELYTQNSAQIDRILIREELSEGNKSLSAIAKVSDIENYAKFVNAGYLGMYNMENWKLAKKRNIDSKKLLDYMGRSELAANLFRVTQTEERIKNKNIKGQSNLEQTHYQVGKEIRNIVLKNTGKNPENLQQEKQIPQIKKELKTAHKKMSKSDFIKK